MKEMHTRMEVCHSRGGGHRLLYPFFSSQEDVRAVGEELWIAHRAEVSLESYCNPPFKN